MNDFGYSMGETLLKVQGLNVSYSGVPILRDVNFEVRDIVRTGATQGQKRALLAPSGTGKTQLFKRLGGLEPADSGVVLIGQEQKPVKAGMVGMVPQNYLLFEHRTIGESLLIAAGMKKFEAQHPKDRVVEILGEFDLLDKFNSYPGQLSGGQKQRISIAEQLLSSNHFLLMDEPFSGLDVIAKKKVMDTINVVASRDDLNTIIFSTHDIECAVAVADTLMLLGHDRDQNNAPIPGARIQGEIDLIERNLAWHPDIENMPEFAHTVAEIKAVFSKL